MSASRRKFYLKPRWLVAHVIIVVAAVSFIYLGLWQQRRLSQRLDQNSAVSARLGEPPQGLDEALQGTDPAAALGSSRSMDYRWVRVEGRFDAQHEVLLRFRVHAGDAGFDVLTPLLLSDGRALLVNRGWVPYAFDTPPITEAAPPLGTVTASGWLRSPQRAPTTGLVSLAPRDPAEGALTTPFYADPQRLAPQMPYPLIDATLELHEQSPPQPGAWPLVAEMPVLDGGPHLGYAIQWFSFATIVLVGYVFLLRRTAKDASKATDVDTADG